MSDTQKTHFADDATLAVVERLEAENAALREITKTAMENAGKHLASVESLEAENAALRRHADNMALAIECAEGFEARDLDFAFDYRQWSKGK